ncbi:aminotransferase class III-fold pyridoxal phosphate-dependent enzyme, partial [Lacticaseibacillus rhamnosus]
MAAQRTGGTRRASRLPSVAEGGPERRIIRVSTSPQDHIRRPVSTVSAVSLAPGLGRQTAAAIALLYFDQWASAAGLATLEVILKEKVVENSKNVGKKMFDRLKKFEDKFEFVGEVRGRGLMIGIELVKNKKTKELLDKKIAHQIFIECLERGLAQTRLHDLLGLRQLRLGIDPAHFILAGFDHARPLPELPDNRDCIGEIIFRLAVGVADHIDDLQGHATVECHHTGVAQCHRTLFGAGVGLLTDRDQLTIL